MLPGAVTCTCNPATLEIEFGNVVGSVPVRSNSPSVGGWTVWPPLIQHKEKNPTKYLELAETQKWIKIPSRIKLAAAS